MPASVDRVCLPLVMGASSAAIRSLGMTPPVCLFSFLIRADSTGNGEKNGLCAFGSNFQVIFSQRQLRCCSGLWVNAVNRAIACCHGQTVGGKFNWPVGVEYYVAQSGTGNADFHDY